MDAIRKMADEACARHVDPDSAIARTNIYSLYACDRAVEPHQDLEGAVPGMRVYGLVLRSDGHRLHSKRLDSFGFAKGIELKAGDFYQVDPYDMHWTTVPAGAVRPQLVFYADSGKPDRRSALEIAQKMLATLEDDHNLERMRDTQMAPI